MRPAFRIHNISIIGDMRFDIVVHMPGIQQYQTCTDKQDNNKTGKYFFQLFIFHKASKSPFANNPFIPT